MRIISYLPNPRLFKATIAARYSGAQLEVVGAPGRELATWLWDRDARPLEDEDRVRHPEWARRARRGFQGEVYKTDAFMAAHPYGNVPAGFAGDGDVGVFESNSIMRAAARLGPKAPYLYGGDALRRSRIDGFLDRSLVFAREVQRYLLAARGGVPETLHGEMAASLASYLGGVEQALTVTRHIADDELTLADIAFACEVCLFTNEVHMSKALGDLPPLLPQVAEYDRARRHLTLLAGHAFFAEDLAAYFDRLPSP